MIVADQKVREREKKGKHHKTQQDGEKWNLKRKEVMVRADGWKLELYRDVRDRREKNVEDLNSIKHPMEMLVLRRTQTRKEADVLISALGFLFLYFLYIFR